MFDANSNSSGTPAPTSRRTARLIGLFIATAILTQACGLDAQQPEPEALPFNDSATTAAPPQTDAPPDDAPTTETPETTTTTTTVVPTPYSVDLPTDLEYDVVETDRIPGTKRSIDVTLSQRLDVAHLDLLASQLHAAEHDDFERTFIGYYLLGDDPIDGYWASTHFKPELEVVIYGLSATEAEAMRTHAQPSDPQNTVGTWLIDQQFFPGRITIWEDPDGIFMQYLYAEGYETVEAVTQSAHELGTRFDVVPDAGTGDYQIVDSSGNLLFADDLGVWLTIASS